MITFSIVFTLGLKKVTENVILSNDLGK